MLKCTQRTAQGQRRVIGIERKDLRNGGAPVRLLADEVLSFEPGRRVRLFCEFGTLWVTQEKDQLDHVLGDSKTFITGRRGRIVVWAMTDALVVVQE